MRIPEPRLPGAPVGSIQTEPARTPSINVRPADTSSVGRDMMRAGQALNNLGGILAEKRNRTTLREINQKVFEFEKAMKDPANGMFTRRAGDAVGLTDEFSQQFSQFRQQIESTYGDKLLGGSSKESMNRLLDSTERRLWGSTAGYESEQLDLHESGQIAAGMESQMDRAVSSLVFGAGDLAADEVSASFGMFTNFAEDLADMRGLSGEARTQFVQEQTTQFAQTVAQAALIDAPLQAKAFVEEMVASGVWDATEADVFMQQHADTFVFAEAQAYVDRATGASRLPEPTTLIPGLANIAYDEIGIRKMPLQPWVKQGVNRVVTALGPGYDVRVTSAGQPTKEESEAGAGPRTGKERHDHGHAADFVLMKDGVPVTPSDDPAVYERLAYLAGRAGFTGVGIYPGFVHLGGGKEAAWGADGSAPTDSSPQMERRFAQAFYRGRAEAQAGPDPDPAQTLNSIPDDRVRATAWDIYNGQLEAQEKARKAASDAAYQDVLTMVQDRSLTSAPMTRQEIDQYFRDTPEAREALGPERIQKVREFVSTVKPPETPVQRAAQFARFESFRADAYRSPSQFVDQFSEVQDAYADGDLNDEQYGKLSGLLQKAQSGALNRDKSFYMAQIDQVAPALETEDRQALLSAAMQWGDSYMAANDGKLPDERTARDWLTRYRIGGLSAEGTFGSADVQELPQVLDEEFQFDGQAMIDSLPARTSTEIKEQRRNQLADARRALAEAEAALDSARGATLDVMNAPSEGPGDDLNDRVMEAAEAVRQAEQRVFEARASRESIDYVEQQGQPLVLDVYDPMMRDVRAVEVTRPMAQIASQAIIDQQRRMGVENPPSPRPSEIIQVLKIMVRDGRPF